MFFGGSYQVYKKVFTDPYFDYIEFYTSIPLIGHYKECDGMFGCVNNIKTTIDFPTEITFLKSEMHWVLMIKLFGFGFSIKRQWTY